MNVENEGELGLADTIRQAMEPKEDTGAVEETTAEKQSSDRDELGRFKPKEEAAAKEEPAKAEDAPAEPPATEEPPAEGRWKEDKAPQSWNPAAREKWNTIDPEIRAEIVRREEAAVEGVRRLREQFAPAENFLNTVRPIVEEARALGADPGQFIAETMRTEKALRSGSVADKFQVLLKIADGYGIPLRKVINESVGSAVLAEAPQAAAASVPPEVQQRIDELDQWRREQESAKIDAEIEVFASNPANEFFEDVREAMADLMDLGRAKTLQEAYDMAVWMNSAVREVLMSRKQSSTTNEVVKERQQQASGVSIKPSGKVPVKDLADEDDDLETTVRKAMGASTGRV